jgi:hypothetical protein
LGLFNCSFVEKSDRTQRVKSIVMIYKIDFYRSDFISK